MPFSLQDGTTSAGLFWGKDSSGGGSMAAFAPVTKAQVAAQVKNIVAGDSSAQARAMGLAMPTLHKNATAHLTAAVTSGATPSPLAAVADDIAAAARDVGPAQISRVLSADKITSALTAPSGPSENYFNVLRALVAAVRTQLLKLQTGAGGNNVFATPPQAALGDAFPANVVNEDPDYFWLLKHQQQEQAYKSSDLIKGLGKAYGAVGDKLVYAFDRKPLAKPALVSGGKAGAPGRNHHHRQPHGTRTAATTLHALPTSGIGDASIGSVPSGLVFPGPEAVRQPEFRAQSSHAILAEQGRDHLAIVSQAAGNVAIGVAGTSGPPLAADTFSDTLRWAEQQRVANEQRRARCEHVLDLLSREMHAEAERQKALRGAAAKYAAAHARATGGDWHSYITGFEDSNQNDGAKPKKGGGTSASAVSELASKSGLDPKQRTKSLRFTAAATGGTLSSAVGKGSGAAKFTAADLAHARYEAARERAESSDALMRILEDYRLVPVSIAAAYLGQTLEEVDQMYAELVGARARQAGHSVTDEQVKADMHAVKQMAEDELYGDEDEDADGDAGGSVPDAAARRSGRRLGRPGYRRPPGVVLPTAVYVTAGGAAPLSSTNAALHEDLAEVKRYGPHNPNNNKYFPDVSVPVRRASPIAAKNSSGNRQAAAGGGDGGGLSTFNLRPYTAREAVREAAVQPLAGLDDGYRDLAATAKSKVTASLGGTGGRLGAEDANNPYAARLSRAAKQQNAARKTGGIRRQLKSLRSKSKSSASLTNTADAPAVGAGDGDDDAGAFEGYDIDAALQRASDGLASAASRPVLGMYDAADQQAGVGAMPPRPMPEWQRKYIADRRSREQRKAAPPGTGWISAAASGAAESGEGCGGGGGGTTAMEQAIAAAGGAPPAYVQLDKDLHAFQLGSRPMWQAAMMLDFETGNIRESTGQMFGMVQRTAKEPPDGRYSHLLGRYMKADEVRRQIADARKHDGARPVAGKE